MCLATISKRKPKPEGFGWKVFRPNEEGRLFGEHRNTLKIRSRGKWLNEKRHREADFKYDSSISFFLESKAFGSREIFYPFGWHVFRRKKDAVRWCKSWPSMSVCKVEYRGAHTQGKQRLLCLLDSVDCVVAKEIKILPKKD